jgi:hypothetical protein
VTTIDHYPPAATYPILVLRHLHQRKRPVDLRGAGPVNSANPRRSFFRSICARLTVLALAAGVMLIVSAPASLATCPPTDPLCVVDEAAQPSLPPVDDVEKAIDDAVESAKGEADKVVGQVTEAVDELLNPGGGDPGGGNPGGGGGGGGGSTGPIGGPAEPGAAGSPGVGSTGSSFPAGAVPAPGIASSNSVGVRDKPGIFGRIGGAAVEVATQLGFPLALALVVIAFAATQNYLDRRDPKLALAPVRPEVMRFE